MARRDEPRDDDETPWTRQLLVGAGVLVAVALVIGGVISVVALGAAKVSGLGDTTATASASPSLYMPSGQPTTKLDTYPDPTGTPSPTATASATASSAAPKPKPKKITLQASPLQVGANQRITLTGVYPHGEGATVQVQRLEAGTWTDFPVTATVTGQLFSTYITTGRTGVNRLRVQDPATGRTSAVVRVTVR